MDFINKHGISVFLSLPMAVSLERLRHSRKPRPLLENVPPENLETHLKTLMDIRLPFYQKARLSIEEQSMQADQLAQKVLSKLNEITSL